MGNDRTSSRNYRVVFPDDSDVSVHRHQCQEEDRYDEIDVSRRVCDFAHGITKEPLFSRDCKCVFSDSFIDKVWSRSFVVKVLGDLEWQDEDEEQIGKGHVDRVDVACSHHLRVV